jgi:hypothetical protein
VREGWRHSPGSYQRGPTCPVFGVVLGLVIGDGRSSPPRGLRLRLSLRWPFFLQAAWYGCCAIWSFDAEALGVPRLYRRRAVLVVTRPSARRELHRRTGARFSGTRHAVRDPADGHRRVAVARRDRSRPASCSRRSPGTITPRLRAVAVGRMGRCCSGPTRGFTPLLEALVALLVNVLSRRRPTTCLQTSGGRASTSSAR